MPQRQDYVEVYARVLDPTWELLTSGPYTGPSAPLRWGYRPAFGPLVQHLGLREFAV